MVTLFTIRRFNLKYEFKDLFTMQSFYTSHYDYDVTENVSCWNLEVHPRSKDKGKQRKNFQI